MKNPFEDPLEMTPQERRRRIVELLAIGFVRWMDERRGQGKPSAPPKNGLASSAKSL